MTTKTGKTLAVIGSLLALMGCESDLLRPLETDIGPMLSAEEIKTALSGNSVTAPESGQGPMTIYFPGYGEMRGLRSNSYRDTGTWEVKDDAFCGNWNNWWGTMARCWQVHRSGNTLTLKRVDGERMEAGKLVEGNPGQL